MSRTAEAPFTLADRPDLSRIPPHCERALAEVCRVGYGFLMGQS